MPTTKQLYGREGRLEVNGVSFSPKQRAEAKCDACGKGFSEAEFIKGEIAYSKTKRGTEIFMCPLCFKKYYGGNGL